MARIIISGLQTTESEYCQFHTLARRMIWMIWFPMSSDDRARLTLSIRPGRARSGRDSILYGGDTFQAQQIGRARKSSTVAEPVPPGLLIAVRIRRDIGSARFEAQKHALEHGPAAYCSSS